MAKKVSYADIQDRLESGTRVKRPAAEPIEIKGLSGILAELIEANNQRLAESKRQFEQEQAMLRQLNTSINNNQMDLSSLEPLLRELAERPEPTRPSYTFSIERDNHGLITGMTARPTYND